MQGFIYKIFHAILNMPQIWHKLNAHLSIIEKIIFTTLIINLQI